MKPLQSKVSWCRPAQHDTVSILIHALLLHTIPAGQQKAGSVEAGGKFILKRIFTERGPKVRLAGLREAYFGKLLQHSTSVLQVLLFMHVSTALVGSQSLAHHYFYLDKPLCLPSRQLNQSINYMSCP